MVTLDSQENLAREGIDDSMGPTGKSRLELLGEVIDPINDWWI